MGQECKIYCVSYEGLGQECGLHIIFRYCVQVLTAYAIHRLDIDDRQYLVIMESVY